MPASLLALAITPENFAPYGQVISATEDGTPYNREDAQLEICNGIPRFYIMRLYQRGQQFNRITRHVLCTQCLGALEGKDWLIAVAPPRELDNPNAQPDLNQLAAFYIPSNCFIKLHVGTWHAGPFFQANFVDFYNLELSDTNITDHHTVKLDQDYLITQA